MDFKSFLSGEKLGAKEHYWALVIEPGWIQAGIWEIAGDKAEVTSVSPPAAWEVEEEIIGAADTALSAAVQNLPEDIGEPSKTVFGVPTSWVSEGQIKAEHLEKIKRICSELSLEPSGFVVLPEAIAHHVKSEEGAPLNAVVIGVGDENIEISVFKLGNLVGNSVVARSVSIADDVAEGLARFSGSEALPSRLLLYDGKEGELEEVRQNLLKVSWEEQEKVKFLHTPKVEIVDPDTKVLATALAGASEIANVSSVESTKKEYEEEEGEIPPETENVGKPDGGINAEDLGFAIGEDVAKKPGAPSPETTQALPTQNAPQPSRPAPPATLPKGFEVGRFFARVKNFLVSLLPTKTIQTGFPAPGKRVFALGLGFFVFLIILSFVLWWYLPKAVVSIYVSPKNIEQKTDVVFDTTVSSPDLASAVIPAQIDKTEVSGDKTKSTTGTKVVGEKAKGSVKIRNGTASNINLAVGTILAGTNDLKFSINSAASVSAALSPSEPGTATVDVSAVDIGSQYNLGKDETFKVGNYPKADVDAVALSDFSGGTSREISAVSEDDQKGLEEELTAELLDKAKQSLSQEVGEDKLFIEDSLTPTVGSKSFSNKVGDEASTLKLSLDLKVSGIAVDKKMFYEFARETLKEKVPSGFVLRDEQLKNRFVLIDENKGVYEMEAVIAANLLPELKIDEIAKNISGRSSVVAERYLSSIPGFSRAEIKIKPPLFGKLKVLPRITKNIQIEVAAER
ncbi:hypothetical protein A2V61_03625 [Candidatus Woesebacteria bacterium RBG_19FT_COMBO_47_8]|uniref:Baseplate protein J-like domain-containing protein n=1 Tax=Candidatus Woesebacteria bacterium RBG_13_46_13 TaxID=1802479 RepID=A0A1F7X6B1_9BACT|nr:MAG: hypothetical protein A2Y68_02255 [Candidatus Woesebacteria bacterium RBG_13_46_13]OGM16767.1 MAG: hypothetical protein A2V61_03625 [Candidatus Woesebacteria bacterium RBG_19FT_COMBO_47_8]